MKTPISPLAWVAVAAITAALAGALISILARVRQPEPQAPPTPAEAATIQTQMAPPDAPRPVPVPEPAAPPIDFSRSNTVSIRLGEEGPDDGLRHLAREADGRTTVETLDGVPCRHLNRKPDNKSFGYVYFLIDPTFKRGEPMKARIDIEYFLNTPGYFRLQYDALEGDTHRAYKTALATEGETVTWGNGIRFMRTRGTNAWQTATFHIADGAFMNAQNGGADFRLEVTPAEIYLRRVTVTREDIPAPPPPPVR